MRVPADTTAILPQMSTGRIDDPVVEEARRRPAPSLLLPRASSSCCSASGAWLWLAARAARNVVEIIIVASFIALILNPLVSLLPRRGIAAAGDPAHLPGAAGGDRRGQLPARRPISNQIDAFPRPRPGARARGEQHGSPLQHFFNHHGIHIQLQKQGQTALQTIQAKVLKGSSSLLSFTTALLEGGGERGDLAGPGLRACRSTCSSTPARSARSCGVCSRPPTGRRRTTTRSRSSAPSSGYVRAQLLFSVIMGATAGVALFVFGLIGIFPSGRTYAFVFGTFFGVMELVPYIGPVLGAIPPIAVALFQNPLTAVWVVLLFIAIQQARGPRDRAADLRLTLRINPLLVIIALLFGDRIYGIVGALMALPVAAVTARDDPVPASPRRARAVAPGNPPTWSPRPSGAALSAVR